MDVFPCGRHIQEVSLSEVAFLALLKKILRLPLWHGTKTGTKQSHCCTELKGRTCGSRLRCSLSVSEHGRTLSLGGAQGRGTPRRTQLLRDNSVEVNAPTAEQLLRVARTGEVFEENRARIRAQNILTMIGKGKSISHGVAALEYTSPKR